MQKANPSPEENKKVAFKTESLASYKQKLQQVMDTADIFGQSTIYKIAKVTLADIEMWEKEVECQRISANSAINIIATFYNDSITQIGEHLLEIHEIEVLQKYFSDFINSQRNIRCLIQSFQQPNKLK